MSKPLPPPAPTITDIPIKAPALGIEPDQCDELSSSLGLVNVKASFLQNASRLGLQVEGIGIVRLATGVSALTLQRCVNVAEKLEAEMDKAETPEEKREVARAIGYLARSIADANRKMVQSAKEARVEAEEKEQKRNKSFRPGSMVGVQVTINDAKEKEVTVQEIGPPEA